MRVTVGVAQVEAAGGFLHQLGLAVGVRFGVAAQVGVGGQGSGRGLVAVGSPQVVL